MKLNKFAGIVFLLLSLLVISCGEPDNKPKKGAKDLPPPKKEIRKSTAANTIKDEKPKTVTTGATPAQLAKAKEIIAGVKNEAIEAVDAKKKYKMFCTTCHGMTGDLNVNGAKDLTLSKISLEESVAQIYHGKGLMTPFKGILENEEIVAVSKYIVKLRN